MKTLSTGLATHLAGELTTTATLIKITRRDGEVLGFTSFDADLTVDDVTYAADNSFQASALESRNALSTDNLAMVGILSSGAISDEDIASGRLDHARIDVYVCNWADLSQGLMQLRRGWLGEVTRAGGQYQAELRGLHDLMQRSVGDRFTPSCRHDLGDAKCGVDVAALAVMGQATVITDNANFLDSERGEADGAFDGGLLTWTSGANEGFSVEVKRFEGGVFSLWLSAPFAIGLGDDYSVVPGCDKRPGTCRDVFNKVANFGGFPYLPGIDQILDYPAPRSG